jgi:hypothetical protein
MAFYLLPIMQIKQDFSLFLDEKQATTACFNASASNYFIKK